MYKKITCVLLAAISMFAFAGCGPKTAGGKTELLVGLPGGHGSIAADSFVAKYQDKYDITFDEGTWNDFAQKVKLQLAAKKNVTPVFLTDSIAAQSFAASGALEDLTPYIKRDLDPSLYTKIDAVSGANGEIWGVPQAIDPVAVLYNKDIFDEKGIPYPEEDWTWQEMLDTAAKLTFDRNGDGEKDVYGIFYATHITLGWWPFMTAMGVSPYKDNFRNSNLNDPLVQKAMEAYQKPIEDGIVPDPAILAPLGGEAQAFMQGKIAMYITQSSTIGSINKNAPDLNYDAQALPIGWNGERTVIYVPNVWVMYKDAPKEVKEASWEWIKHYLSEDVQKMAATDKERANMPIMKSVEQLKYDTTPKPANYKAFFKFIDECGVTILENPTNTRPIIDDMCKKVRALEGSISDLLQTAHEDMQQELDFYYNALDE